MDALEKIQKLIKELNVSYERAKNALEACNYDYLSAKRKLERENLQGESKGELNTFLAGLFKTLIDVRRGDRKYFSIPLAILIILLIWKPVIVLILLLIVRPILKIKLNAAGPLETQVNKLLSRLQEYVDKFFE